MPEAGVMTTKEDGVVQDTDDELDVETMSDDEVKEALDKRLSDESDDEEIVEPKVAKEPEAEGAEKEPQDEAPEKVEQRDTPEGKEPKEPTLEESQAENAKLQAQLAEKDVQIAEKELFAQRQSTAAGTANRKFKELEAAKNRTNATDDPLGYSETSTSEEDIRRVARAEREESVARDAEVKREEDGVRTAIVDHTEKLVRSVIPGFDDALRDEIATLALADGGTAEDVANFKTDPFGSTDPATIISYARRVEAERAKKEAEDRLAEVTKKEVLDADAVAKKIQATAKSGAALTGKVASVAEPDDITLSDKQVANLSPARVKELLKERKRKEGG